ncbi:MAG: exodeoxyribonuclease VII small subunit [Bacillota bacterium]
MSEPGGFEADLKRLEEIVRKLETGSLSLEDSLREYEEGCKLVARCETLLAQAEARLEELVKKADGGPKTEPFQLEHER